MHCSGPMGSALDSGFEGGGRWGDYVDPWPGSLALLQGQDTKLDHNSSLHPGQGHSDSY